MPQRRKATTTKKPARKAAPKRQMKRQIWSGTGLCCEAQGDGVPCKGVDGECETCGKALPQARALQ